MLDNHAVGDRAPSKSFFDPNSVLKPIDEARGLPNVAYTDLQFFNEERIRVFASSWAGLGFVKDIGHPGEVMPVDYLGQPLLMVHDKDGVIRVFQNTCRHRGMILVEEKKQLKAVIRCPYHSWCYGLDGALRTTPHVGGPGKNVHDSICREDLGLVEIRSAIWQGIVFVNLDGNADPFDVANADLMKRWSEFDQPFHHGGGDSSFKLELNTNWKLAVENYSESYHLPWVHPGLNSYSRLEDHYNIVESGSYCGQGTLVYRAPIGADGRKFCDFSGLSSKWDKAAEYITFFPNVMLGVHRDHVFVILIEPKGPDKIVEHVELFYASDAMTQESYSDLRTANAKLWKSVFEEDIKVVEGMQRGRSAERFDGGRFSPVMDEATHAFHTWVAQKFVN